MKNEAPQEPPILLRIPEVMHLTRLGRTTIYGEINAGRLKTIQFGRAIRIHRADLDAWIKARANRTPSATEKSAIRRYPLE